MIQRTQTKITRRAGFTLMEMLVVVAIIVALAGIGGFLILPQLVSSQKDAARAQVNGPLSQACKTYFIKNQSWPPSLQVLLTPDSHKMVYIDRPEALLDPWGNPYQYDPSGAKNNGTQPDIWTTHADGTIIGNWSTMNQTPR
jgi:general secretion pathway protein G